MATRQTKEAKERETIIEGILEIQRHRLEEQDDIELQQTYMRVWAFAHSKESPTKWWLWDELDGINFWDN